MEGFFSMRINRLSIAAVALVGSTVLIGCGSSSKTNTTTTVGTGSLPTAVTTQTTTPTSNT